MRRLRKTCIVTLLLASSSFQFGRFIAAQSPQAARRMRKKTNRRRVIGVTNDAQFSASRHVHTFG